MSLAKKCDRCGCYYDERETKQGNGVAFVHLSSNFDFGSITTIGHVEASKDCTDNDIRLAILNKVGVLNYYKESED